MPFTSAGFHLSQQEERHEKYFPKCAFLPYMGTVEQESNDNSDSDEALKWLLLSGSEEDDILLEFSS